MRRAKRAMLGLLGLLGRHLSALGLWRSYSCAWRRVCQLLGRSIRPLVAQRCTIVLLGRASTACRELGKASVTMALLLCGILWGALVLVLLGLQVDGQRDFNFFFMS